MTESTPPAGPVIVTRDGPVVTLALNRPDRLNAVSRPLYEALFAAVRDADGDATVRALVLTGTGRAFCAGADLKAHAEGRPSADERRRYARAAQRANLVLQRCGKPIVAAVNGPAVGAGLELALSCDFIVAATDAKLRLPEIALGTFFGGGVAHTLPERVGAARARQLLFLGEFVTGEQAAALGLADTAVATADVVPAARQLAARLAERAPVSLRMAKRLLAQAPRMARRAVMRAEARALVACMATADWAEGIAAHAERRAPRFTGE